MINENVTQIIYLLPYRFHLFYTVENMPIYTITYALQLPFVFVSGFGQSAADCIMVTLVFHICGQMSVLALRINNIDTDPCICKREVRHMVLTHIRLLRWAYAYTRHSSKKKELLSILNVCVLILVFNFGSILILILDQFFIKMRYAA
jgi:hypothetical protein